MGLYLKCKRVTVLTSWLSVGLRPDPPFRMGHSLTDRISDSESEDTGPIPVAPTI